MVDVGIEHCNDYVKRGKEMMVKNQIYCFHGGGKCDYIDLQHSAQEPIWVLFISYVSKINTGVRNRIKPNE